MDRMDRIERVERVEGAERNIFRDDLRDDDSSISLFSNIFQNQNNDLNFF